jgi:two-component system sensor histidine kinase UhpB
MLPRQITHRNILLVLAGGFTLVILLLLSAAIVGVRGIQSIARNTQSLLDEEAVTGNLIGQLRRQQTTLTDVFSNMARDPDSLDDGQILDELKAADADIQRISSEGQETPEKALWQQLQQSSTEFSGEARRILAVDEPETFAPAELFRDHENFTSLVAKLVDAENRKLRAAQREIAGQGSNLLRWTAIFAGGSVLLALVFAVVTVRMAVQLIQRLEGQTAELGRVSWHLLEDQEATARRFSHELHDELGQGLTAIKTNLSAIDSSGASNSAARVKDALSLVDEAIGNVRQMSQLLRPTILDDFGLQAGIRWLAEGFSERTGVNVSVETPYEGRLPGETETHLFRITQEALTNIARHSEAKRAIIRLEQRAGEVFLTIRDDGHGLSHDGAPAHGMGMIGMRARARSAGGDVQVQSTPGQGVVIEVRAPLRHETNSHPLS